MYVMYISVLYLSTPRLKIACRVRRRTTAPRLNGVHHRGHYRPSMSGHPDATDPILSAASLIRGARYLTAFTGAGISVESGIPPFRGSGGLWSKYDPRLLEIRYFLAHPEVS